MCRYYENFLSSEGRNKTCFGYAESRKMTNEIELFEKSSTRTVVQEDSIQCAAFNESRVRRRDPYRYTTMLRGILASAYINLIKQCAGILRTTNTLHKVNSRD